MPALKNRKHEVFAVGIVKGLKPAQAYADAGFSENGADAGACRLLKTVKVFNRIAELKELVSAKIVKVIVADKDTRLTYLQESVNHLSEVVTKALVFGAQSGEAELFGLTIKMTPVYREIRETLKQVAIEKGEWSEKREITGKDGGPLQTVTAVVDTSKLTRAQLLVVRELVESAALAMAEQQKA